MKQKNKNKQIAKSFQCIRYDLHEGLLKLYPLYLLGAAAVLAFAISAWDRVSYVVEAPGVMELNIKIFEGMPVFHYVEGGERLNIPMNYLAFALIICLSASYYARKEWRLRGNMFLTRYQSKGIWWLSKCILCAVQAAAFYAMTFLVIWLVAGVHGNWGFQIREEAGAACQGMLLTEEPMKIFLFIYVLGACTIVAVNQMITAMQMLFSPIIGYVTAIGVFIGASCIDKVYVLGNNLMLLRTRIFDENGVTVSSGLIAALIFWLIFIGIGWAVVRKKDVL